MSLLMPFASPALSLRRLSGFVAVFNADYMTYSSDTSNPTDNLRYFAGRGGSFTLGWDGRF